MPLVATRSNAGAFGLGWGAPVGGVQQYQIFDSVIVTSASQTIEFTDIPQTHVDLRLVWTMKYGGTLTNTGLTEIWMNGNDFARGSYISFSWDNSSIDTLDGTNSTLNNIVLRANDIPGDGYGYFGGVLDVSNYADSTYHKPWQAITGNHGLTTGSKSGVYVGNFVTASPITTLTFRIPITNAIQPGSSFALYGIGKV